MSFVSDGVTIVGPIPPVPKRVHLLDVVTQPATPHDCMDAATHFSPKRDAFSPNASTVASEQHVCIWRMSKTDRHGLSFPLRDEALPRSNADG